MTRSPAETVNGGAEPVRLGLSPRLRKSPFYEATRRSGFTAYTVYNHMVMPATFRGQEADFWHLIRHVSLWDVAAERQVEIAGPDAAALMQLMTPRNLSNFEAGQCKYLLITDGNGGVVNDPIALKLAEDRFWLSLADSDVLLFAEGIAHGRRMDVTLREPDVSPLQIQGPKAVDVMRDLFGTWIDDLKYFRFRETDLDGIPVLVSRTGWSSERGYEIFLRDGRFGEALWDRIMAAGEPYQIAPGAPNQIRRIEGGMLSYGTDVTLQETPLELGLERLIDLEQEADFMGKDALRRLRAAGPARKLVGIELEGPPLEESNQDTWALSERGGDAAATGGKVTSCIYSPRLRKNIGLAYVPTGLAAAGSALEVAAPGGARAATVVPLPFFDPKKQIASAS